MSSIKGFGTLVAALEYTETTATDDVIVPGDNGRYEVRAADELVDSKVLDAATRRGPEPLEPLAPGTALRTRLLVKQSGVHAGRVFALDGKAPRLLGTSTQVVKAQRGLYSNEYYMTKAMMLAALGPELGLVASRGGESAAMNLERGVASDALLAPEKVEKRLRDCGFPRAEARHWAKILSTAIAAGRLLIYTPAATTTTASWIVDTATRERALEVARARRTLPGSIMQHERLHTAWDTVVRDNPQQYAALTRVSAALLAIDVSSLPADSAARHCIEATRHFLAAVEDRADAATEHLFIYSAMFDLAATELGVARQAFQVPSMTALLGALREAGADLGDAAAIEQAHRAFVESVVVPDVDVSSAVNVPARAARAFRRNVAVIVFQQRAERQEQLEALDAPAAHELSRACREVLKLGGDPAWLLDPAALEVNANLSPELKVAVDRARSAHREITKMIYGLLNPGMMAAVDELTTMVFALELDGELEDARDACVRRVEELELAMIGADPSSEQAAVLAVRQQLKALRTLLRDANDADSLQAAKDAVGGFAMTMTVSEGACVRVAATRVPLEHIDADVPLSGFTDPAERELLRRAGDTLAALGTMFPALPERDIERIAAALFAEQHPARLPKLRALLKDLRARGQAALADVLACGMGLRDSPEKG